MQDGGGILAQARIAEDLRKAKRIEEHEKHLEERRQWVEVSGPILLRRRMKEKLGIVVAQSIPVRRADLADRSGTQRVFDNCCPSVCLTLEGMVWGMNEWPADQLFLFVRAQDGKTQWEYVNELADVARLEHRYGREGLIAATAIGG
jgi:hypothetical protein